MTHHLHNRIARGGTLVVLILSFLFASYIPAPFVHRAAAIDSVTVIGGPGTIAETISASTLGIIAGIEESITLKEFTLDGIAYAVANIAIQKISRSIVQWINSGFQGSPAFVTDLQGFLIDVADQAAGQFLTELGLGFMCSPFKLDVQLALALQYQAARDYEAQCTLSDIVGSIDNFFSGNFAANGGWAGWFSLTTRPGNNPYGALLLAEEELAVRVTNAKGEQSTLLSFGKGFLSFKECDAIGEGDVEEHCTITTPGAVIEEQVNLTLGSGQRRLEMADEINEIIGALFAQLVQQAFTGAGGLLGLTSSGYSANGFSYIEAATTPSYTQDQYGYTDNSQNPITNSIQTGSDYLDLQHEVVSLVNDAELYERNRYTRECSNAALPNSLSLARQTALQEARSTEDLLAYLQILETQYYATSDPLEQDAIMDEYLTLRQEGEIVSETDNALFDLQVIGDQWGGIVATINNFKGIVDSDCQTNNGF